MGAPQTLPSDFQGWDKAPATLPADFKEWDKGNAPGTVIGNVATISAGHGDVPRSAGLDYSRGYAGAGDAPRDSGSFIERAETQAGRALSDPRNFIPSWKDILLPGLSDTIQSYHDFQDWRHGVQKPRPDPAKTAGNMAPAVLSALVTHAADAAPNVGEASGSTYVPAGVAHPIQGAGRFVRALEPDLPQIIKHPVTSTIGKLPGAVRAGLGEDIRIQAAPRSAPAWQATPSEAVPVPSILDREPTSSGPGRTVYPAPEAPPMPRVRIPAWKVNPGEGAEVPSILDRAPTSSGPGRTVYPAAQVATPESLAPPVSSSVSSGDPILDRLRENAARIEAQGHGDEDFADEQESSPQTTNLNQDLTPALKKSLAKVRAAKRIAVRSRPNSASVQ